MRVVIEFDEVTEMVDIKTEPDMTEQELMNFLFDCLESIADPEPVH